MSFQCGYVYLLKNESMPGLYKIGYTTKDVSVRVDQLSKSTGVPTDFDCLYQAYFKFYVQPHVIEQALHREFDSIRVSNKEFFRFASDGVAVAHVAAKMLAICEMLLESDALLKRVLQFSTYPETDAEMMYANIHSIPFEHVASEASIHHQDMICGGDIEDLALLRTLGYMEACYGAFMLKNLGYTKCVGEGLDMYLRGGRFFKLWLKRSGAIIRDSFNKANEKPQKETLQ